MDLKEKKKTVSVKKMKVYEVFWGKAKQRHHVKEPGSHTLNHEQQAVFRKNT